MKKTEARNASAYVQFQDPVVNKLNIEVLYYEVDYAINSILNYY